ncbi:hypothetical protein PT974_05009 [Cladobotryum mycophilum]|uniref:Uncharacterized protein n=1 Tax=Cladobotryum mycophilum TaxID=491253 RepID=A0ABR0SRY0_9HYPO
MIASIWISPLAWASIFMLLFLTLFNVYHVLHLVPNDKVCGLHGMAWTPVDQGLNYEWQMFPWLTLFTKSDYFGDPVEDADKNWQEFLPESPIAIPKSRLRDLKPTPDSNLLHPPRDETRVLALPEVFVELGCINLLRQHLNRQRYNITYSDKPAFQGPYEDIMYRADLCLNRLREAAMCWGDMSSILQNLTRVPGHPIPDSALDYATRHKCRDFEAVARWTENNAVKAVRMRDMWWGGRVFY